MDPKAKQTRLVESMGDELAALLSPLTPQAFVNEYWGRKPLYVKGFREKYKGFFDAAAFQRAVATPGGAPAHHLKASFDKSGAAAQRPPSDEPADVGKLMQITPEQVGALFEAGATICVAEISARVPRLAYFCAAIKRQLGYPGAVAFNAYLSPPGVGFNWHFDGRIASTLQIEGSKRWRFSKRAVVEWPRGNAMVRTDGSARYDLNIPRAEWESLPPFDKKDITEVVLEPGDFLSLPAGTWHDAAGGKEGSLALNLAFNPIPYTAIVGEVLEQVLGGDSGWRCAKPLLPQADGKAGEAEPRALEALGKQLENAAKALQSLAADSSAVARVWSTYLQSDGPGVDPPAPLGAPLAPTDRLRVRADGNVYVLAAEKGRQLSVGVGTRPRFELTGDAMRVAQRAIAARKFEAVEGQAWGEGGASLEWSDVAKILTNLLNEGLLERVTK